jgi:phospholipase C
LWNYAQDFAISDNFFNPTFGLSTPAGLNLIAGQTHSAVAGGTGDLGEDVVADTVIGDPQPSFNDCSTRETMQMTGRNVGDLLTEQGITWGWFQGASPGRR